MIREFESEVLDVQDLAPDVRCLRFSVPEGFDYKAGQYVSISVDNDGKKIRRPYSIASNPLKKGFIELCVKNMRGLATTYIFGLKKGDKVEFLGPMGAFVINEISKEKDIVFISVGVGIAPFISMIPNLLERGYNKRIILINGERCEEGILYERELNELKEKYPNFELHNILSRPKDDCEDKGHVQDFLDRYVLWDSNPHFYICGLSGMINEVIEFLKKREVSEDRIYHEKYD
jgi:ring-1,2-phenylacetyl-CoA epoxidase subunit PaaE